ncbi:PorV/PorQ family protein [Candidatus Desantisbacteria bacterium]|nr:PorV/PorQ family protein [Candidatus Desantisbacteria bacterium]
MRYWILIILTSIIFPSLTVDAQGTDNNAAVNRGVTGANFLKIGISPRALALGGAYSSLADDAAAVYFNPAGLIQINGYELSMMQNNWLPGIGSGFISYVHSPEEKTSYACSVNRMDVDKMPETKINANGAYEATGNSFGARDTMLIASYATLLSKGISLGSNLKFINEEIANKKSFSMAIDSGILYQMGFLRLGMAVQNLGTGLKFVEERAKLPIGYRFGASVKGTIKGKKSIGTIETATWLKESNLVSLGIESYLNEWLAVRLGYRAEKDMDDNLYLHKKSILKGFSYGFGLSPSPGYQVDYALVPQGDFGFTHIVSLRMRFIPKPVHEEGVKEEIQPAVEKVEEIPAEKEEKIVKKPEPVKPVAKEEVVKKPEPIAPKEPKESKEIKKLLESKYIAIVLSDNVTLWSGPGVTYQAVTTLNKGTRLRVIDDSKMWYYHVQLEDGTMGWVSYVFVGKE